ncbi:MAG TPA: hypothetical protein VN541_19795 [Tepidisphaeraceae bacterium]|nr:hypothetical protein [Tepidisphaeraceae bacterium]
MGWSSIALPVTTDKPLHGRRQWSYFGFGRIQGTFISNPTAAGRRTGPLSITVVPFYPMVIASALPPLAWVTMGVRRRRRRRLGLCPACGYDLTGNVSGVCPECGKPVRSGGTNDR